MSRDGSITLNWADGERSFRLRWRELILLQEACDAGPQVVLNRLQTGHWRMNDIRDTVRLGLIGGGATPEAALKLVQDYVEARPPVENVMFAVGILAAGLMGAPDEEPGEAPAAPEMENA